MHKANLERFSEIEERNQKAMHVSLRRKMRLKKPTKRREKMLKRKKTRKLSKLKRKSQKKSHMELKRK